MIELYTWPTPNGMKVQIMLEECGLPYEVKPVNIIAGEQFAPWYLALNPNNKVPTITDPDGPDGVSITLMETGAILLYLAEKTGRFGATDGAGRWEEMQWLMWQMGGLGPMLGQAQHFHAYAPEDVPYGKARYFNEGMRLLRVLDARLDGRDYICGAGAGGYGIVDMACFPWVRIHKMGGLSLADCPNVSRWYGAIRARPAVEAGINVLMDKYVAIADSQEGKETLFGQTQYEAR